MNNFLKMLKENKKLGYAVNVFILLIIISLILKLDFSQFSKPNIKSKEEQEISQENYVYTLEKRMEKILGKIDGIKDVNVMIYTKKTPVLEPVYDENTSNEITEEIKNDGTKREVKRETKQNKVILDSNTVVGRYYQYPEISGVLVVVNYSGTKDIYGILMNSVKTLLNIKLNDIEIVVIN